MIELRDHIATEAMKVILANTPKFMQGNEPEAVKWIAEAAYIMADQMMEARGVVDERDCVAPPPYRKG